MPTKKSKNIKSKASIESEPEETSFETTSSEHQHLLLEFENKVKCIIETFNQKLQEKQAKLEELEQHVKEKVARMTNNFDKMIQEKDARIEALEHEIDNKIEQVVDTFQHLLQEKHSKIEELEQQVVTLENKVDGLEEKLEDTESYERRDTVVISGSAIPQAIDDEDSVTVATTLIKEKIGIVLNPTEVSIAHRMGKKPDTQTQDKRSIIMKLCRREMKQELLKACKTVKPKDIFVNESLTRIRSTVLYGLRQAKKKYPERISGCGSNEGKVFVWLKPPNPKAHMARNTRMTVNTRGKFEDLCKNILKCKSSELVKLWPK